MLSFLSVLQDAPPTTSSTDEKHLAVALGYPLGWRVVRRKTDKNKNIDTIYAGNPNKGVDCWVHHEGARKAAAEWLEGTKANPYARKGGHLLPKKPKFQKNDVVEVKYKKEWYLATILKKKDYEGDFLYTVHYSEDDSTQADVREKMIRMAEPDQAAADLAHQLGFPDGWKATQSGSRYTIISPDDEHFRSKKKALEYLQQQLDAEGASQDEDPPWRTTGHDLLGRKLVYESTHKLSGKRTVTVAQTGTIVGWISEVDKDRQGEPGYVSEATGQPADLFHVKFQDEPGHPYAKYLLDVIDLEMDEISGNLVEEEEEEEQPPSKRAKKG